MIGRKTEAVLNRAVGFALENDHEYFTLEHVLWALLSEPYAAEALQACGADLGRLRRSLESYLTKEIPKIARSGGKGQKSGDRSNDRPGDRMDPPAGEGSSSSGHVEHPVATLSIQRLIQRALFHVQSAGKDEIQPIDLLVAMFQAKDSHALFLLGQEDITRLDVLNFVSHGIRKAEAPEPDGGMLPPPHLAASDGERGLEPSSSGEGKASDRSHRASGNSGRRGGSSSRKHGAHPQPGGAGGKDRAERGRDADPEPDSDHESMGDILRESASEGQPQPGRATVGDDPLNLYCVNLNARARAGKIDPLIGRQIELDRVIQTLCRRRKNNPLLVGEAGVGKTAIAEGLALRIVSGDVPDLLKEGVVFQLDLGSLLAGTKFRGDFEQRLKKVFGALERERNHGQLPILLIDEIHTIVGAGAVSGGALDAANLLKPVLTQGEIRCIGSTTYNEYRTVFEKDHALARRFQKIDVTEPTIDDAVQILNGLKPKFEDHHLVTYTPEAIRAAVELSSKHLVERFLPDKAIDVIDEAGARLRLRRKAPPAPSARAGDEPEAHGDEERGAVEHGIRETLDVAAIEEVIAQIARIPARSVTVNQKESLRNLERDLKLTIFGQNHAIDALVTSIRLARSGLRSGDRPVGSFLFCGPTGVGKTELSRQLARCLGVPFLRYDMSEYSEKHTVSRLIGAPPGYVGFEQAGLLTDAVMKHPHSVVLLDEVEKAHSEIWNILLQVMDHGTLTDNNGRKADFRNIILIMTSNVGSRDLDRRALGLVPSETKGTGAQREVERVFNPEFRNRFDSILYFNPLDPVTIGQVVGKQLLELESQLLAKGVEVDVAPDVREWLAQKGYDRLMGARPMRRLIEDRIKKPLANEILFGSLEGGGVVRVKLTAGELAFEFEPTASKPEAALPTPDSDRVAVPVPVSGGRGNDSAE